jgi:hypothetical protein
LRKSVGTPLKPMATSKRGSPSTISTCRVGSALDRELAGLRLRSDAAGRPRRSLNCRASRLGGSGSV